MRNLFFLPVFVLLLSASAPGLPAAEEFREVTPDYRPHFPDDFYYRDDYRIQWWYFTGHLFDAGGREFGFELTFFAVAVQNRQYKSSFGVDNIYISHFAVSDIMNRKFYFSEKTDAGAFGFAGADGKRLKVWVGNNELTGTMDRMHIIALGSNTALDLDLAPAKPVVLNGHHGYSRKSASSPLAASIYFSYTDLKTDGTLVAGGKTFRVSGKSWFDREISSRGLSEKEKGWDWFSVQLKDDREIMLYVIRNRDGSIDPYSSGTLVSADGSYRHLGAEDFEVTVQDHYRSAKTGAEYPSRWRITLPSANIDLLVVPLMKDQEVVSASTGNRYWEGTCKVEGRTGGRAYVELTGY